MWVKRLEVVDFRSYEHAVVTAEPGAIVLLGPNGQGKTNVVEAVAFTASLTSHRVHTEAPLVRTGSPRAVIRIVVVAAGRDSSVELELNPGAADRARVNGQALSRMRDVVGHVRCCVFAPEHLRLVKGEPGDRRRFLDTLMVQVAPRYLAVRADFDRALRQRTAALRSLATAPSAEAEAVLNAWDERYVPIAAELTWGRMNAVRQLQQPVAAAYAEISPGADTVAVDYESALGPLAEVDSKEELTRRLADRLRAAHPDEVRRAVTLVGPHRDDLALTLNGQPARIYASHGESWSLALALQLASFQVLADIAGEPPILVLDDVFAELDETRRERLVAAVSRAEQVFVTAAVAADVPDVLADQRLWVSKHDDVSTIDAAAVPS